MPKKLILGIFLRLLPCIGFLVVIYTISLSKPPEQSAYTTRLGLSCASNVTSAFPMSELF